MRTLRSLPRCCALLALLSTPMLGGDRPFLWDRSEPDPSGAGDLSAQVVADDFELAAPARLEFADVWLRDDPDSPNDNGALDAFAGTLGWALFADESGLPGTLLKSGADAAVELLDSGLEASGADIVRARFTFGEPVSLAAGTYWLALDEGEWGSGGDGSPIAWVAAATVRDAPAVAAAPAAEPAGWTATGFDTAFVVYGSPTLWNQDDVRTNQGGLGMTSAVHAVDFRLPTGGTLGSFETWINDDHDADDGVVENFSGTLGWAVYANSGAEPGELICSGQDPAPQVFDTGIMIGGFFELFRMRGRIAGCLPLPAGVYWLALKEGDWGAAADGSEIFLQSTISPPVRETKLYSLDEQNPGDWQSAYVDSPFVLLDDLIFASGFESGTACAWESDAGCCCP